MNAIAKKELDKLGFSSDNYGDISAYSKLKASLGAYDETYTEYLTKIALGG